jgi:tetratricopeptide (TPR) repeat protein
MKLNHLESIPVRKATSLLLLALATTLAIGAEGPSVSEVFEKAIYSEQTKGDLDGAMQLYQQVVTQAKAGQAIAAQAQYHIGACFYKKKDYANANAAFEKLIKDYPDQKELVAKAQEYLAGAIPLMPVPWTDGEEMRLDLKLAAGLKIGASVFTVDAAEIDGRKIWRFGSRLSAGVQSFSTTEAEADSLKPIHSRWKHMLLSDVDTVYFPDHAELKTAGKDGVKKLEYNGVIFDNEETVQWMRRLPFTDGYKTTARLLASLGFHIITIKFSVTGPEKVEVPAGSFECYKVDLSNNQTFWYSSDAHRYLVKFEAGGAVAELTSVRNRPPAQPANYQDPAFGFSLSAPAGWYFDRQEEATAKSKVSVAVLDPEAMSMSSVEVQPVAGLSPESAKSIRAFAEQAVTEGTQTLKDFKIRDGGWQQRTVAGQPAISFVADYLFQNNKSVSYCVFTFSKTNAVEFSLMINQKDFETFRPKFDAIIDSYKPTP